MLQLFQNMYVISCALPSHDHDYVLASRLSAFTLQKPAMIVASPSSYVPKYILYRNPEEFSSTIFYIFNYLKMSDKVNKDVPVEVNGSEVISAISNNW